MNRHGPAPVAHPECRNPFKFPPEFPIPSRTADATRPLEGAMRFMNLRFTLAAVCVLALAGAVTFGLILIL